MATTPTATTTAARASQRSCWRSVPPARRNRTTSDQAPTGMARTVTASATWAGPSRASARPGTASGLATERSGSTNGWGSQQAMATSGAAAATLAHQRQRGDGGAPVGVSSRMSPGQAPVGMPACCS